MRRTVLILILALLAICSKCHARNESRALLYVQKAISKTRPYKENSKALQNKALKRLELDQRQLAYLAPALAAVQGKVDSRQVSKIRLKVLDGILTPVVIWDMRNKEINTSFNYNLEF